MRTGVRPRQPTGCVTTPPKIQRRFASERGKWHFKEIFFRGEIDLSKLAAAEGAAVAIQKSRRIQHGGHGVDSLIA